MSSSKRRQIQIHLQNPAMCLTRKHDAVAKDNPAAAPVLFVTSTTAVQAAKQFQHAAYRSCIPGTQAN